MPFCNPPPCVGETCDLLLIEYGKGDGYYSHDYVILDFVLEDWREGILLLALTKQRGMLGTAFGDGQKAGYYR